MLGPLIFLLYINDIIKNITSSKFGLFANDCVIYLGIQLDNTLSWNTHITTTVNKATGMLNFIKRNLVIQLSLLHIPHLLGQSWNMLQKSGTLIISFSFTRLKWCRDMQLDGFYQTTDFKAA